MSIDHSKISVNGPTISFTPTGYRADGEMSLPRAMQMIGLLGLLGMVLGVIASFISQFVYLIILFPLVIGGCIGTAGTLCIQRFHVRNPLLCGLAGFTAGCLAMATMHYTEFKIFEHNLAESLGEEGLEVQKIALRQDEIRADWDNASQDEKDLIIALEEDPEGLEALRANTIARFVEMRARQGVTLSNGGGRAGLNLGYTGSYIYWIAEALIVAVVAFSMMSGTAAEPYCAECCLWKTGQLYGPFSDASSLKESLESGHLSAFKFPDESQAADLMVTLYTCPDSEHAAPIDVRLERWTNKGKGDVRKKKLTQMTYPNESLPVLVTLCSADDNRYESGAIDDAGDKEPDAHSQQDSAEPLA